MLWPRTLYQSKHRLMSIRVLPTPEKFASCPSDEKILQFYEGQFDSVYILLHPFIHPNSIDIERFCPEKWPTKQEIIESCTGVSWGRIIELTDLKSLSEIDVGLRTRIGGIKKELANGDCATCLNELIENHNIIPPPEGDLPPLLENRIYEAFKSIGYKWLWVGDEFGTERKLYWIDDLIEKDLIPSHGCIFTHDHSMLVTTHWDSHCSFLCSSKKKIKKIIEENDFEGFFCTENTEVYWGAYEI